LSFPDEIRDSHVLLNRTDVVLLQIVCGICAIIMGSVAIIEERGKLNLSLGIAAGVATVLAAGK
jgi:hypothetical protein